MTDQDRLLKYVNNALKKGENTKFKRTSSFYEFVIQGKTFFVTTNGTGEEFINFGYDPTTICSEDPEKIEILRVGITTATTNEANKNSKGILDKLSKR